MDMLNILGIYYTCIQQPHSPEVKLRERIRYYNQLQPNLIYSIHGNASKDVSVRGSCCFVWSQHRLADKFVRFTLAEGLRLHGSGIHYYADNTWTDLAIIEDTISPAILTENGFFTNDAEREMMVTDDYLDRTARIAVNLILYDLLEKGVSYD